MIQEHFWARCKAGIVAQTDTLQTAVQVAQKAGEGDEGIGSSHAAHKWQE